MDVSKSNIRTKRGSNFSKIEIRSLMMNIFQEIHTIENKKTDCVMLKEKQQAWKRIETTFNSSNTSNRDLHSLKMKYENIKRDLKKKMSALRLSKLKTGGGPPEDIPLLWYEEKLYSILQLNVDGLESMGDSDDISNNIVQDSDDVEIPTIASDDASQASSKISTNEGAVITNDNKGSNKIEVPVTISTPHARSTAKKWNLKKRKRVTVAEEDRKENLENFDKLAKSKTDLTEIQKKCYEVELKIKEEELERKRNDSSLKSQILEVELNTKNEQYNEVLRENLRKAQMFNHLEEEQKVKLDILKCELNAKLK